MKNDIETKKSDVGFSNNIFTDLSEVFALVDLDSEYAYTTRLLKEEVSNIFSNYLKIGFNLSVVQDGELFKADGYSNIYEYAKQQLDLSETTVKSVISISKNFCDSNGYLLKKYDGFSYSSLVELLSVPVEEISQYSPSMSVKSIRSLKLENSINEKLDYLFKSEFGIKSIIEQFVNFTWNLSLLSHDFVLNYTVKKDPYKASSTTSYSCNNYGFKIAFVLSNSVLKVKPLNFDVSTYFNNNVLEFGLTCNSSGFYIYEYFKDLHSLFLLIKKFAKKIHDEDYFKLNPDSVKSLESNKCHEPVSKINVYSSTSIDSVSKAFVKTNFMNLFYESSTWNEMEFFAAADKSKKKNPCLFKLIHMHDPFTSTLLIFLDGKVSEEILIFPDFKSYIESMYHVAFSQNLPSFENMVSSPGIQTTIDEFIPVEDLDDESDDDLEEETDEDEDCEL